MASPTSEAAALADPKALGAAPPKDAKSETNGHASPASPPGPAPEPKAESEKPVVNGDRKSEEHGPTNGVAQNDVTMGNGDDAKPTETAPSKPDETSIPGGTESKVAETSETAPPPAGSLESGSQKDVEMEDSKPVEESPKPAQDEKVEAQPAEAPSTETPSAPKNATSNDIAQEDVEKKTTEPATKSTEQKPELPVKADQVAAPAADSGLPTTEVDIQPASLSQLAIGTSESGTSPVEASVEVSMTDAPNAKVAREREYDAAEEPASKRARTEPKEDEPSAPAPAPAETTATAQVSDNPLTSATVGTLSFDELPRWSDSEFLSGVIKPFQIRDLRKSMGRVKKTKNGQHFRDSVQKLWPVLWDKYSAIVSKPMDLGEIDRNLRDGVYKTFGDVKNDLLLIAENSLAFNGPDHDMTKAAKAAIESVWHDVLLIPAEEPVRQKPPPKQQNRHREPRSTNVHPDGAGAADRGQASTSSAPKPGPPASDVRRASTNTEGDRPKRTVRAPKPKDIDYTTKPSRKKLKPELQFCDEVLSELMRDKYHHLNKWFNDPVDVEGLGIPHYYSIITQPMDFGKIQRMLHEGDITSWKEFDKNVRLVFSNCYKFNGAPEIGSVSYIAKQLEDIYNAQVRGKDAWLAKHAKANPPPAASAGSEDDEDDEDDDGEDAGPDPSREVKDLEARLREEMDKQANLFAAEQPNQSMIQIQQGIVNMVQQALLQAKQKLNEYKQKNGGAGGKAKKPKPSKAKAGGGGGRKSGGATAQPKKAAGGGGQKKKKNLTAADKDNIANAINDLEYPHLDKAIEIIKRDTGQMESEDGELELDIDQLSHEALLKLWELCKKVLPGFGKDSAAAPNSSPEVHRGAPVKQAKTAGKPKKNKPMSAEEQEARIAKLREIRDLYKPGQEPADEAQMAREVAAMHDSSDDSSEEE